MTITNRANSKALWSATRQSGKGELLVVCTFLPGCIVNMPSVLTSWRDGLRLYWRRLRLPEISPQSVSMTLRDGLLVAGLVTQLFLVLAGLRKPNLQLSYSFFLYLVVVCFLVHHFLSHSRHSLKSIVLCHQRITLDALKTAVLIEFNHRVFRFYPQVKRSNYWFFTLAIFGLALYLWLVPAEKGTWWGTVPLDVHAKIMQANCFLFFVFTGSILFYRLHIDRRHKLLLIGFLFSQFPLAFGFAAMAAFGAPARELVSRLNSLFFVIALLIWAKVYLKNDSVDHTRITTDPGMGRPADSGPSK